MVKSQSEIKKLYYSIGEVSGLVDLKQYVLRYWETEFPMLRPQKNRAGNRKYRKKDIDLVLRIKNLLYNKKVEPIKAHIPKNPPVIIAIDCFVAELIK